MTPHHWAISSQYSEDIFLQNVRNKLPSDAASHPGKMESSNYNALEYGEKFIFTNMKPVTDQHSSTSVTDTFKFIH
jgi:hypothetical protein